MVWLRSTNRGIRAILVCVGPALAGPPAEAGPTLCGAMSAALISTTGQLEALEPEWLELWRRTPDATPFPSPAWLLPWWGRFGSHELSVITLRDNGRLSGAQPLYVLREDDESLGLFRGPA